MSQAEDGAEKPLQPINVEALREMRPSGVKTHYVKQEEHYRQVACDNCGLIMPQNQAHRYECEVATARSGPAFRDNVSFSNRYSSTGRRSTGSRVSFGSSSGRTYYKKEVLLLCDKCYEAQIAAAAAAKAKADFQTKVFLWVGGIVLVFIIIAMIHPSGSPESRQPLGGDTPVKVQRPPPDDREITYPTTPPSGPSECPNNYAFVNGKARCFRPADN